MYSILSERKKRMSSNGNIVSVLKQKMVDNKMQVERYKEEIKEKENFVQVYVRMEALGENNRMVLYSGTS